MKNLFSTLLTILAIIIGGSLILFIFRLIWSPPGNMGMMMTRGTMYNHMGMWMMGTFFFIILVLIIILIIWLLISVFKK